MQPGIDPQAFVQDLQRRTEQMRERAEALKVELMALSTSVTSKDRAVTVTVGAGGILRDIVIESAGVRRTPTEWSRAVMQAYSEGCRTVGEQAAALVEAHTPGTPAAAMMRDAIPPEPEEDLR